MKKLLCNFFNTFLISPKYFLNQCNSQNAKNSDFYKKKNQKGFDNQPNQKGFDGYDSFQQ